MNYRDYLQQVIYKIINPLIRGMIKVGITPNTITTIGFIGNCVAAGFFIAAAWMLKGDDLPLDAAEDLSALSTTLAGWGGFIILFAGLFDMMDGRLARMGNMSTTFGAFWDSTLDRYSELISLFGIVLIFFYNDAFWMAVVTFLAMIGSVMVSYTRARAEGLGLECKVGLMQRPERVVVLAVTALITGSTGSWLPLEIGIAVIAVLANITAFWRVGYVYKQLK